MYACMYDCNRNLISDLLERHSKDKRARAQAYSRVLRRIKGVFQRVVHGKLRSDFQRVRHCMYVRMCEVCMYKYKWFVCLRECMHRYKWTGTRADK